MAWNPNIPTVTNRVQDDLDAIRENFQVLDGHLADTNNPHNVQAQQVPYSSGVVGFSPADVKAALDALAGVRIVEMGSNGNGTYVRWENGLQVCWHGMNILSPRDWGASYTSGVWTLPAEFVDNEYARFATAGQSESGTDAITGRLNAGMSRHASSTPSSCRWSVRSNGADNSTGASVFLLAIGRWK